MINQLVDFKQLLSNEPEEIRVLGATFKIDFGPWKKGDTVDILHMEYELGRVIEYTMSGQSMRFSYFGLVPTATPCPENKPVYGEMPFDRFMRGFRARLQKACRCGVTG